MGIEFQGATKRYPGGTVAVDSLDLTVEDAPVALAGIVGAAAEAGMSVTDVEVARPDLESVFLNLTGRALRD